MPLFRRNEPETRSLIAYLVARTRDKGVTLNQTKLVKLLYLVEVERIASGRDPLTGLDWVFYLRVGSPPVSDGEAMSEPCPARSCAPIIRCPQRPRPVV
jgi:hypothetical protein